MARRGTFLDSNIFLRHLLNDDPVRSSACRELFRTIERHEFFAWTSSLVISEVVFILSNPRTYGIDRETIRDLVLPLIALPNLRLERKQLYPRVFEIFVSYLIDYVDAYHAALLEHYGQRDLLSFDHDFDALPGLTRREPE
jgi:predicted nucleic acid-binding protein